MGELIILIILIALSAFFAAAETAITSLSRIKISRMVEEKVPGIKMVKRLKENPNEFLSTILIANNSVNTAAAAIATSLMIHYCESWRWGREGVAIGLATGIMTFLILVFGEIAPKTIAIRNAEKISICFAPVIIVLQYILRPIAFIIGLISRPIIHLFGGKTPEKGPFITEEDIQLIIAAGEKEGVIEEEERQMINSIFEFGETIVREVMTPRPDIIACEVNQPLDEVKKTIFETGHSRIPVYEGNLDNVVGVVYSKDLLKVGEEASIAEIMHAPIFVPETKKVAELMHEMQAARTHLAVIVDEFGITYGLVSLEDLVEEIVGEIHDEFERGEKEVEKIDRNTMLVDGKVSIASLNRNYAFNLPEGEYDTLGGCVFGKLGKAPSVGDCVGFADYKISVERIHRRRITRLKIEKQPVRNEEEAVGG